jgi:transcriptional regulator with XRE-family HTH domain
MPVKRQPHKIDRFTITTRDSERPPVPEHANFGTNLRHLLGMHNVSQQRLARYVGLSPQGLWNILHGRSEPRSSTAQRIAAAFGITMDALFADTGSCVRAAAGVFERAPVRGLAASDGESDRASGTTTWPAAAR